MVLLVCQDVLGKKFFSFCACFCLTILSVCVILRKQGAPGPSALLRCVLFFGGAGPVFSIGGVQILPTPQHTVCIFLR